MTRLTSIKLLTRSRSFAVLILFSVVCLLPPAVSGQSATATLSGTIQDQNGAVIPNVEISVLNRDTALERKAVASSEGYFAIAFLPPGTYTVTARQSGFAPVQIQGLVLNVGDQKALHLQLQAGDVNAQVTVDSNAETIRTDGSVGTVVNRQQIANMPLNGRSLHALVQLTPGVVLTPANSRPTGGSEFSVNGQRASTNSWLVDGVSANTGLEASFGGGVGVGGTGHFPATTALGGTNSIVSLDALQEFRVETSSYAAEYGRTPGGQISLVTRSGTNQFHGSVWDYFRNEALDANDWFANANRLPKPVERQNLFGGVLGGPLYLPRFGEGGRGFWSGKNKLFFFGSFEGLRLQQPQVSVVTVPTVALRAQAVPALQPYLNAFPLPNGPDFGDGTAQFAASNSSSGTFNIFALRVDARVSDKVTAFYRLSRAPSESKKRAQVPSNLHSIQARNHSYTGGVDWVAGPQLTADVRINWTRNAPSVVANLDNFGGAVVPSVSDAFAPGRNPSNSVIAYDFIAASYDWGAYATDAQRQFNAVGTIAWSVGAHQLKLGIDYRRLLPLLGSGDNLEFLANFEQQEVRDGNVFFDQIISHDPVPREPLISELSLFAQDTWHAGRRLTLTYGLRFERVPPPGEATGRLPRTLLGIEKSVLQNPRLAPVGTPLFRSRLGEFAPRFGVAYQLSKRPGLETTLRGGGGIFYDTGLGGIADAFNFAYPFAANKFLCCGVPFPLSAADRTPGSFPVSTITGQDVINALAPNLRMPYTIQWNGAIEQSLGSAQSLTASYVGAAGRRLLRNDSYRTSLADFPNVQPLLVIQRNLSKSDYSALQVQYRRRLQRGLQALVSYTLGRSQDDASADNAGGVPSTQSSLLAGLYAPSDYDVRHVLSAAVTYDVPKLSEPGLLQVLSKDWGLDLLVRYQSALPVNPRFGSVRFPDGTSYQTRPDVVPGQALYINDPGAPGGLRFNRAAFARPAPGQQGNFPRNGLRWLPVSQVDLALRREFKLGERVRLQLRGELFNLFNHPNFGLPEDSVGSDQFGLSNRMLSQSLGGLNALYEMGGARSGQLAVKIVF